MAGSGIEYEMEQGEILVATLELRMKNGRDLVLRIREDRNYRRWRAAKGSKLNQSSRRSRSSSCPFTNCPTKKGNCRGVAQ